MSSYKLATVFSFMIYVLFCLSPIVFASSAADVLLWKRWHVSFGAIIVATIAWITFEQSGLSFLSICSDVLLILIMLLFLRANYAVIRNKYDLPNSHFPHYSFFIVSVQESVKLIFQL